MKLLLLGIGLLSSVCVPAVCAECFGEGEYRVCSESAMDDDGNGYVRSWDAEGNEYRVDVNSRSFGGNGTETTSSDSDGNSYSIRTWIDSNGDARTRDSEGNECIITQEGQEIGCD